MTRMSVPKFGSFELLNVGICTSGIAKHVRPPPPMYSRAGSTAAAARPPSMCWYLRLAYVSTAENLGQSLFSASVSINTSGERTQIRNLSCLQSPCGSASQPTPEKTRSPEHRTAFAIWYGPSPAPVPFSKRRPTRIGIPLLLLWSRAR